MRRRALGIAILLIVAAGISFFWYVKSQDFTTMAAGVLAEEISSALDADVSIGTIYVKSPTTIGAGEVVVRDRNGNVLARAEKVETTLRPLAFVAGDSALKSIRTVEAVAPQIYLEQYADGTWNYETLLKEESEPSAFAGTVVVDGAVVSVRRGEQTFQADEVDGTIDFSSQPAASYVFSCRQGAGSLEVSGNTGSVHEAVSFKAKDFDLTDYLEYLPKDLPVELKGGKLSNLEVTLLKQNGRWEIDGEALVLGLAVQVKDTVVDQIDGLILFDENELRLFSRGQVGGQPIVLRGTASLDMKEPILDMTVSSKGFDASQVFANVPLSGAVGFEAIVSGRLSSPMVDGKISIASASFYGRLVAGVSAGVKFKDRVFYIEDLRGQALGGDFGVSGQVNMEDEGYRLHVTTSGVSLAGVEEYVYGVMGRADTDVIVSGRGFESIAAAGIYGKLTLTDGSYAGVKFSKAEAGFLKRPGVEAIELDYLNAGLDGGSITASGFIGPERIAVTAQGQNVDLRQFALFVPDVDFSGYANFSAEVSGNVEKPVAAVQFNAVKGSLLQQPYETAAGKFTTDFSTVHLQDFKLEDGKAQHIASGDIWLAERRLDLKVVSSRARAENLMKLLLPDGGLTGYVDNTVVIKGPISDFDIEGEVSFYEGSYYTVLLASAHGKYTRSGGRTEIQDFTVNSPNLQVRLSGVVEADETLDFLITADEIDIGKLRLQLPYPVSGLAKFTGKLQGSLEQPQFAGVLTSKQLVFNGQPLDQIEGRISYGGDILKLMSLSFKQGKGVFSLSGTTNLDSQRFRGNLDVKQGDIDAILDVFNVQQDWLSGSLDGNIHLEGSAQHPKVRLWGNLSEGSIREYPLDTVDLDVTLEDTTVSIQKFYAKQNEGVLAAAGQLDLAGDINLEIAGQSIDAALLTHLAQYDLEAKGMLDFGAQISGTAKSPRANVSVEIKGGGVGTATFDSLYGLFTLENGIIDVEQMMLTKDPYKATAYGVIPLAALTKKGSVDVKEQMDLKVSLDQADLTILPFLTKQIEWAMGRTHGTLALTGTLEQPRINGAIGVEGGAVKFKYLAKPVQNLSMDMQFTGDRMELKTFEGSMGKGGYRMFGASRITGDGLQEYEFTLQLDKPEVVSSYFTGPLEGNLVLKDDAGTPKISGNLDFKNCIVDIPSLPESEEALPKIRLDVDMNVGPKVRLYNPLLYDMMLEGHVHFGGSTRHPQSSGEITAQRGTVSYLKTPFQVRQATALFNQVGSFLPSVEAEADTRLSRTKIYLSVLGPADRLQLKVWSSPEMSEQEILSLLTLRSRYYEKDGGTGFGQEELTALVDLGLQMSFLSEVESMIRSSVGVDEFNVVRDTLAIENGSGGTLDKEVYNLEIGKYITDQMMLKYTAGIDHDAYRVGVRYDFNSNISLTSDLDQDDKMRIGIEARFKF